MSDAPKLRAYAVALCFKHSSDKLGVANSVWTTYTREEATAWAMHAIYHGGAKDQDPGDFAGFSVTELTEEMLSNLLNAIRTGGKGATVLQAVPPVVASKIGPMPLVAQEYLGHETKGPDGAA